MRPIFTDAEKSLVERALKDSDRPDALKSWRRAWERGAAMVGPEEPFAPPSLADGALRAAADPKLAKKGKRK